MSKINVVWDMETGDPDDFLTLLLLLGHPQVNLKAVTITPGGADQVHVVKWALAQFGKESLPLGVNAHPNFWYQNDLKVEGAPKHRISRWHYRAFGIPEDAPMPEPGDPPSASIVMSEHIDEDTTLITGAPLKNMSQIVQTHFPITLGRWVGQGGFAGEGVVPPEKQLPKFRGKTTVPTYNFNGHPTMAKSMLATPNIKERYLVSKNVCHGVHYNAEMHEVVGEATPKAKAGRHRKSLELIHKGMEYYLAKKSEGKKFHDPLAACCAIDPSIGEWAEVEVFREKGEWGSRLCPGSNTWIIVDYDRSRFVEVLTGVPPVPTRAS